MYKIISLVDGESTIFVVFNNISKKEVARYDNYKDAFQYVLGRQ